MAVPAGSILAWQTPAGRAGGGGRQADASRRPATKLAKQIRAFAEAHGGAEGQLALHRPAGHPDRPRRRATAAGATSWPRPFDIAKDAAEKAGITLHEDFDGDFAARSAPARTSGPGWQASRSAARPTADGRYPGAVRRERTPEAEPADLTTSLRRVKPHHGAALRPRSHGVANLRFPRRSGSATGARMIETPPRGPVLPRRAARRSSASAPSRPTSAAADAARPPPAPRFFDTQTGFAVRRWCPPLLGLEPHCPPARYLARRRELGVLEAGRRLLRGSGIAHVPGRHRAARRSRPGPPNSPPPRPPRPTRSYGSNSSPSRSPTPPAPSSPSSPTSPRPSTPRPQHAVAFTSVRHRTATGSRSRPSRRAPARCGGAAGRWLAGRRVGGGSSDPVLLRHLLWIAVASGLPLQLHVGLGATRMPLAGRFVARHRRSRHAISSCCTATRTTGTPRISPASSRTSTPTWAPRSSAPGARAAAVLAEILELGAVRQAAVLQRRPRAARAPCGRRPVFREALARVAAAAGSTRAVVPGGRGSGSPR